MSFTNSKHPITSVGDAFSIIVEWLRHPWAHQCELVASVENERLWTIRRSVLLCWFFNCLRFSDGFTQSIPLSFARRTTRKPTHATKGRGASRFTTTHIAMERLLMQLTATTTQHRQADVVDSLWATTTAHVEKSTTGTVMRGQWMRRIYEFAFAELCSECQVTAHDNRKEKKLKPPGRDFEKQIKNQLLTFHLSVCVRLWWAVQSSVRFGRFESESWLDSKLAITMRYFASNIIFQLHANFWVIRSSWEWSHFFGLSCG